MIFGGFQKLTLLDFPGVVACTLFTKGCNFRCPFCHNASLVVSCREAGDYTDTEILEYLQKRKGILEGVCVTGGEPLMHAELDDCLRRIKALGYKVKLDTNGSFPAHLRALVEEGLVDYVAMDIKNAPERYAETSGLDTLCLEDLEESIRYLLAGRIPYEFRTTVAAELHTVANIESIAKRIEGAAAYYIQNFKDSGDIIGGGLSSVDDETLREMCRVASAYVPCCKVR